MSLMSKKEIFQGQTTTTVTIANSIPAQSWIHGDLSGPMLTTTGQHKYVLCIPCAFTKYVLVTLIENKEQETSTKATFSQWNCKFSLLAQIHTNGGNSL
jgi:hypothetical protein